MILEHGVSPVRLGAREDMHHGRSGPARWFMPARSRPISRSAWSSSRGSASSAPAARPPPQSWASQHCYPWSPNAGSGCISSLSGA